MADYVLLQELCEARGTSGREEAVREILLREASPYGVCWVDGLGNLIVEKKGARQPKEKLMLSAHMDEVGLIITRITSEGYLRFDTVGGIDEKILPGAAVEIGEKAVAGVIGAKPIHLLQEAERNTPLKTDQLMIDIGAESREEAEQAVCCGDMATFCSSFSQYQGSITGRALDDRAGCALLIELLRRPLPWDMTFAFLVQEEVGLRGAKAAAFAVAPTSAIIVETTIAADVAGVPEEKKVCYLGKGPVISFMDRSTIYDKDYYRMAFRLAEENNIPCQPKLAVAGGNDAGAIHTSREGVRTLALSLPCRYLHSPVGRICSSDYEAAVSLLERLACRICQESK